MSDTESTRPPGPWDNLPAPPASPKPAQPVPVAEAQLEKGQHPLLAIGSTLLLAGLIYLFTNSVIIVVAVIFGLFVHEYGHVLAMNRLGMGPARIHISFFGGLAKAQRLPANEWHGVLVSLAGPAFGLLAAIPFLALFLWSDDPRWLEGVFAVAILNLVNLAPAPPLDGSKALGPVLARIHPMVEKAALVIIGLLVVSWALLRGSYIFAAFLAIALLGHLQRGGWRPDIRPLTGAESAKATGLFVLTALACVGVALAALMPIASSLGDAALLGAGYFGYEP
jgi:Zn-dependent protease